MTPLSLNFVRIRYVIICNTLCNFAWKKNLHFINAGYPCASESNRTTALFIVSVTLNSPGPPSSLGPFRLPFFLAGGGRHLGEPPDAEEPLIQGRPASKV